MISKTELCKVIAPSYVEEGDDTFEFYEKKNKEYGLQRVEFKNSGHYVTFNAQMLQSYKDLYTPYYKEVCFQKDCDKVVLFEKAGKSYLVWIEVKTKLNQVSKSAIFQIPGGYYRVKSVLDDFDQLDSCDITECAIAVYAKNPPDPPQDIKDSAQNMQYKQNKKAKIGVPETRHEQIERKYKAKAHPRKMFVIEGSDFGVNELPIRDKYKLQNLPCVAWPVDYDNAIVDFDEIVALL